ncbi:MAG: prepilin-type N-terminal cleavage/methylation domain-containing protein [Actinobacteria bacterium]|nr:prepilin-type N-terminal cleavage/methylation domain-containing protein [Actinomycetota bacterium]MCL5883092.1 prepilin-type N-terminal cleavage/methylation domain-containing protein [Actinomycetota bacterium]
MLDVSEKLRYFFDPNSNLGTEEHGFTLVEMLVSILIFSVIMAGMFTFLWGASSHWQTGKNSADMTDNARTGLNRMTREIRQASIVTAAQINQISFSVDFGTGAEVITYGFTPGDNGAPGLIWRSTTSAPDVQLTLVSDVQSMQFSYYGNDYKCDADGNGVINWSELVACSTSPASKIARVDISLAMRAGNENDQTFTDQAWLRNRVI